MAAVNLTKKLATDLVAGDTYYVTGIVGLNMLTGEFHDLPNRVYSVKENLGTTPWGSTKVVVQRVGDNVSLTKRFSEGERVDVAV
jgi:hypothetical protein